MKRWWKAALLLMMWGAAFSICLWGGGKSAWFLFYALGGLNAYVWLVYALLPGQVAVTRRLQRNRCAEGDSVEVSVLLSMQSGFIVTWMVVREPWFRLDKPFHEFRKLIFPGGRAKSYRYVYTLDDVPRGQYRSPHITISAGDVFGIITKEYTVRTHDEFIAVPLPEPWPVGLGAAGGEGEGRFGRLLPWNEATVVRGVREYVPGDALNLIDWKASARAGQWRTKELEMTGDGRVLIALDAHHAGEQLLERAIRLCAGLMRWVKEQGGSFGFISNGSDHMEFPRHDLTLDWGLELLSKVELVAPGQHRPGEWLNTAVKQLARNTTVVYIGSGMDDVTVHVLARLRTVGVSVHAVRVCGGGTEPFRERKGWEAVRAVGCALTVLRKEEWA